MRLTLNPALDAEELAVRYGQRKRILIQEFLTPDTARAVLEQLHRLPWGLIYNEGSRIIQLHADAVARMDKAEAARITEGIRERARSDFQFLYAFYPISAAYYSSGSRQAIFDLYEFINSEPVLRLIRQVTGVSEIAWASAQATYYKPGHFLKAHTDKNQLEGRLAAYVLNFTPGWDPDWGGLLQFFDSGGDVEHALRPRFNALNIFTVPVAHSVSMVAPYVTARRMAVTGWFRSDKPPGPIGDWLEG